MPLNSLTETLVEERDAEMVVVFNGYKQQQQPIKRKGLFLKPTASNSPNRPLTPANSFNAPNYHPDFRWWADPQPQWSQWIEKLKPRYQHIWVQTGIHDAIMASRYKITRHPRTLLRVARFWSSETNTFIFPWGEASVTLEDVMILGGFSVLGQPVRVGKPLGGVVGHIEAKMIEELNNFRRNCPKPTQFAWMRQYMEAYLKGDEVEHVAFLILWLSRFVLAGPNRKDIRECVVQVAVRLAQGARIALAPAVLASIYRDLWVMKEHISTQSAPLLAVGAPFNILQLWVWERFVALKPGLDSKIRPDLTLSVFESRDEFQWRPYSVAELGCRPSFYMDDGGWFCSNVTQDEGLKSFVRCLRACELVGLDCIEQYLPHRVAMQFGLDQDIPNFLQRANFTWEIAWKTYDISSKNVRFYVSPRLFKSAATLQYSNWWRTVNGKEMTSGTKRKEAQPLPNCQGKKVKALNETRISACPALKRHEISSKNICFPSQEKKTCTTKPLHAKLNTPLKGSETINNEYLDVKREAVENEKRLKEEHGFGSLDIKKDRIIESVEKSNAREFCCVLKVIEKCEVENEKESAQEQICDRLFVHEEGIVKGVKKGEEFHNNLKVIENSRVEEQGFGSLDIKKDGIINSVEKSNARLFCNVLKVIEKSEVEYEKESAQEQICDPLVVHEGIVRGVKKGDEFHSNLKVIENSRVENEKPVEEEQRANPLDVNEEGIIKRVKKSTTGEFCSVVKVMEKSNLDNEKLVNNEKEIPTGIMKTNVGKLHYDCQLTEKPESLGKRKEIEEKNPASKKELERDRKIKQLKEEIASIQKRVTYLESVAEAYSKQEPISYIT